MKMGKSPLIQQKWFQILAGGLPLFIITEQALRITGNINFFPTVILLGAFIVPVAFVAYIYERVTVRDVSLSCLAMCLLGGGAIGIVSAGLLEYQALRGLSAFGLLGVGLIEEGTKLILPVVQYFRGRYRSEADGLLFGVAAGMGFAALETMGYGLVAIIESRGSIGALEETLIIRGLLSPAGHAAWTGLICAVIWRERERKGRGTFTLSIAVTFLLSVVLHTLWNVLSNLDMANMTEFIVSMVGSAVIALLSLTLIIRRMREASRHTVIPDEV